MRAIRISARAVSAACVLCVVSCSSGGDGQKAAAGSAAAGGDGSTGGAGGTKGMAGAGVAGDASGGSGAAGSSGSSGGTGGAAGTSAAGSGSSATQLPKLGACDVFSADDAWNQDVSGAAVSAVWTQRLQALVGDINLHPDYGNSGTDSYGIPVNVVPSTQAKVPVVFDWWPDESDPGPYPFPGPDDVVIEGRMPTACDGDCHLLVVQEGECMLYEGYACEHQADGWHCGNGSRWDLSKNSYGQRPEGWTSADAAGLAIMPGLVRYAEVRAGEIRHAIRFTTTCTRAKYVKPATHQAVPQSCDASDPNAPPMGLRVRLKADYDMSGLSASAQVVAKAMQRYGMILADNGSNFYFQGEMHPDWTEDDVEPLKGIPASAFEALEPAALQP
jgi:hypothetical protein